jgi:plasmid stabilization system protein ParE
VSIVRWTAEARTNLGDILAYIERENPLAAVDLVEAIIASGNALSVFPARNPIRHAGDLRERPVLGTRYILLYRIVADDQVIIVSVRHGAQEARVPSQR